VGTEMFCVINTRLRCEANDTEMKLLKNEIITDKSVDKTFLSKQFLILNELDYTWAMNIR